jgi:hypothetical protein
MDFQHHHVGVRELDLSTCHAASFTDKINAVPGLRTSTGMLAFRLLLVLSCSPITHKSSAAQSHNICRPRAAYPCLDMLVWESTSMASWTPAGGGNVSFRSLSLPTCHPARLGTGLTATPLDGVGIVGSEGAQKSKKRPPPNAPPLASSWGLSTLNMACASALPWGLDISMDVARASDVQRMPRPSG